MSEPTVSQVKAVVGLVTVIAEAIRELGEVPSGHLYANLCGMISLSDFQAVINKLIELKFVKLENNLITWVKE